MTNSIYVNNEIKLVKIKLTEEMLEDAYWLNVFYEFDDGEVGDVEEILYVTKHRADDIIDAMNDSEHFSEYNDFCESDEEDYDAGDTVWALVDNQSTITTHNA